MDDVLPNQSPYIPRIMQVSEQDIRKRELSLHELPWLDDTLCKAVSFFIISTRKNLRIFLFAEFLNTVEPG